MKKLIILSSLLAILTGCMSMQKGNKDIQAVDQRVLGFQVSEPISGVKIQFGYISTRTQRIPTSTNVLYSPKLGQGNVTPKP